MQAGRVRLIAGCKMPTDKENDLQMTLHPSACQFISVPELVYWLFLCILLVCCACMTLHCMRCLPTYQQLRS